MQSSLTNYFKTKKRVRDEHASHKVSAPKLLALASPTPATEKSSSSLPSTPTGQAASELFPRDESPIPVPASPNPNESTESETSTLLDSSAGASPSKSPKLEVLPPIARTPPRSATRRLESPSTPTTPSSTVRRELFPTTESPVRARIHPLECTPEKKKSTAGTLIFSSPFSSPVPSSPSRSPEAPLQMPYKFRILEELFYALEAVTSLFHSRGETITFEKVKPGVHEMMRRVPLKERHVEQILAVFPDAYTVELDKQTTKNMSGMQKTTYQLIMTINLKSTSHIADTLTPAVATERRKIFRENLLKTVNKHHQEFLSTLQSPIKIPEHKTVTRWHPRFRLDEVPDIQPEKKLPQPPEVPASANNAKDVIKRAQNILDNANPRMKKALAELLKAKAPPGPGKSTSSAPAPLSAPIKPIITKQQVQQDKKTKETLAALKGVSQSLIDKIRAREEEKAIRAMTLTPEESRERVMMNRIPDFVKSVRNVLVAEKKSVISLRLLVVRLCHSKDGALTIHEIEDHIRLLCRVLPTWASILKLSQGEFVKINKDADINVLLQKFSEHLKDSK